MGRGLTPFSTTNSKGCDGSPISSVPSYLPPVPDESMEMGIEVARSLVLPVPILNLVFCGYHHLCVVHGHEYVLISIASGGVTELFRFDSAYGSPCVRRLSPAQLIVTQPPPRAGERQVGLFLNKAGHISRRSTVNWRQTPLDCVSRAGALITLLPHAIEVVPDHMRKRRTAKTERPEHGQRIQTPQHSLPFANAQSAADGGHFVLVANTEAVYALLPPGQLRSGSTGGSAAVLVDKGSPI